MLTRILVCGLAFLVVQFIHLQLAVRWSDRRTNGLNYYGQSPRQRKRFRFWLRLNGVLLTPILTLLSKSTKFEFARASFIVDDVPGPTNACSPESFRAGAAYEPRPEDVFVATQMRCGTTWMQHLVFQVLTRGNRDLAEEGVALNALSPWLEASKTVPLDEAPAIGQEHPGRIIKTHFPAALCPLDLRAKYIYVLRHPASCFASCIDFVRNNAHYFSPQLDDCEEWFTADDKMWWNHWVTHAHGWWRASETSPNVLFVRFEDMKQDLAAVAQSVAEFLEMTPLSVEELERIETQCSFRHMQKQDVFEMHPPHLLQVPDSFMVSGKTDRYQDIPAEMRERIIEWSRTESERVQFPLGTFYPELVPAPANAEPVLA